MSDQEFRTEYKTMTSNASSNSSLGKSAYQEECRLFYRSLRAAHSMVFTNDLRQSAEQNDDRYVDGNIDGIDNLYTFIKAMASLLADVSCVRGIDYGCGSHYFVDDVHRKYGWDVVGYDVDQYAIEEARNKYPDSAARYQILDVMHERVPVEDGSQNFVFCNAVIQHFDNVETAWAFKEISRVLTFDGILLLIFKRKIECWQEFSKETQLQVNVKNNQSGRIEIEDTVLKEALEQLTPEQLDRIPSEFAAGMRTLHFYSIKEIVCIAEDADLLIADKIGLPNGLIAPGVFTYKSGKGVPTAALFLRRSRSVGQPLDCRGR